MSSWEWQAEAWARWARTPGHDSYWHFRDAFFDAIVPAPGRRALEVGCGEGRVARDLAELDDLLLERVGVQAERALLDEVAGGAYELVPFGVAEVAAAAELVGRHGELRIGLAGCSRPTGADAQSARRRPMLAGVTGDPARGWR